MYLRFGKDKETGEFRGYGHMDFSDSVSVAMALKLYQEIVCGRPVKISCAAPKKGVETQSGSHLTNNEVRRSDERVSSKEVAASVDAPMGNEAPTLSEADNGGSSVSSGKLRRTCYVCGQKGHLSSACPKGPASLEAPTGNEALPSVEAPTGNEARTLSEVDNEDSSASSGKLRRTCYVCGQKGHLSSACPKGPLSVEATMGNEAPSSVDAPTGNKAPTVNEVDNVGLSVSSGKLRRRTCYECGQKGHISSACPKVHASVEAPTSNEAPLSVEAPMGNEVPMLNGVENGGSSVSSDKLRRRTCYECGQKGHISSACPNKKSAETTNANTNCDP